MKRKSAYERIIFNLKDGKLPDGFIVEEDYLEGTQMEAANININTFRHKALEERAAAFSGNLHLDGEFDCGKPVGREVW